MSVVLMFGAGASYGSLDCFPKCPPLGQDLFNELQEHGTVAKKINEDIADSFRNSFELGMEIFWEINNTDVTDFLRETASFFLQFKPGEKNLYFRLARFMKENNRKAIITTTNYDMLIELSVCSIGWLVNYSTDSVLPKNIPVLKVHGSCNFLPDIKQLQISGIKFDLSEAGPNASILDGPVKAVQVNEAMHFCNTENSVAPVMSMYARGKRILFCPKFIESQQKQWLQEVIRAKHIIIIGLAVNPADNHIWEPLASTKAKITYVGLGQKEIFQDWVNLNKCRKAVFLCDTFKEAFPYIKKILIKEGNTFL